jgi:hypothetical protein
VQVVASPVVGKVLIVGLDRTIGTILGGLCGWAAFYAAHTIWNGDYLPTYSTLSFIAFVAAFGSVVIAWKLAKLETTPRLFTLTFILVALGSNDPESEGFLCLFKPHINLCFPFSVTWNMMSFDKEAGFQNNQINFAPRR